MALSTKERIKAARGVKREYRDVEVVLDQVVAEQVDELEERIDAAEAEVAEHEAEKKRIEPDLRFSDPRPAEIDGKIAVLRTTIEELEQERDELRKDTLVRLRFDKMDGAQWSSITAKHPARLESTIDRLSGYNYHATAREAAPLSGYVLGEDDAREDLEPEDWDGLFAVISGRETEWIASSLWELNDFGPRKRVDAARKASADGSGSRSS